MSSTARRASTHPFTPQTATAIFHRGVRPYQLVLSGMNDVRDSMHSFRMAFALVSLAPAASWIAAVKRVV